MTLLSRLDTVIESLRNTVAGQLQNRHPLPEDFATWAWALDELTTQLGDAGNVLALQTAEFETQRFLRDDENMDPYDRLTEAAELLKKMNRSLTAANEAVRQFHATVTHVYVDAQPNATN